MLAALAYANNPKAVISFSIGTRVIMLVRVPLYIGFQAVLGNDWRNSMRMFLLFPPLAYLCWHHVVSTQVTSAAEDSRVMTVVARDAISSTVENSVIPDLVGPRQSRSLLRPSSGYFSQAGCISYPMPFITLPPEIETPLAMIDELKASSTYFQETNEDDEKLMGTPKPWRQVSTALSIMFIC